MLPLSSIVTFLSSPTQEYNVQAIANTDEAFYVGRFASGLPPFSKDSAENRWSLDKEGLPGRQPTDILRVYLCITRPFLPSWLGYILLFLKMCITVARWIA